MTFQTWHVQNATDAAMCYRLYGVSALNELYFIQININSTNMAKLYNQITDILVSNILNYWINKNLNTVKSKKPKIFSETAGDYIQCVLLKRSYQGKTVREKELLLSIEF